MKNLICRIMRYLSNIIEEIFTWCHTQIAAPTLLTATAVPPNIILSWIDNATNNTCYMIWRSTDGTNFTLIDTVNTADLSTWIDTTAVFDQDYWYKVQACDGSGDTSDFSNIVETSYGFTEINYGALYNWYAVDDARFICAEGWHIPTQTEFQTLSTYLGGNAISGGKLKETGFTYWNSPNTGATNEVGYNGRGAGRRLQNGTFDMLKSGVIFWSSTITYPSPPNPQELIYDLILLSSSDDSLGSNDAREFGFSLRPIKDSTSLTHGQTGTYTGNDGKVYATICIGTQEYLSENLAETKYRNLDDIPEVTDNATWAALSTGAWCAYDNDHNNI